MFILDDCLDRLHILHETGHLPREQLIEKVNEHVKCYLAFKNEYSIKSKLECLFRC